MYKIMIRGTDKLHEYEELIKTFLPTNEFRILLEEEKNIETAVDASFDYYGNKNQIRYQLYKYLNQQTGLQPPWGIITGIRPVKLAGELLRLYKEPTVVRDVLVKEYLVTKSKADRVVELLLYQQKTIGIPSSQSVGIYVSIPFCPSRCAYCTFPSNQVSTSEMERYLEALISEIRYTSKAMNEHQWFAETIYIGGGTPTALSLSQLERLYSELNNGFRTDKLLEFCLEAGRPDTITTQNMQQAADAGVNRVSINPQSMQETTLKKIGRNHTRGQVDDAFEKATKAKIKVINSDIIAGLPGETMKDFAETLDEILKLGPQNITVHSLAMKRASRLTEENMNYHFEQADQVTKMLSHSETCLHTHGYIPYYLYRQKHMAGNQENVGYCLPGTENIYNVRIMEENQTILAMGAGGISKAYDPADNHLTRIANVSNYEIYINRIDEMILRKEKDLFRRFKTC